MFTIVIGDGLTNEFLSPEIQFQASPHNVGLQEVERLVGSGQEFGNGPLPTFLNAVLAASRRSDNSSLLFFKSDDVDFIEPLTETAVSIEILPAPLPDLPVQDFREAVGRLAGIDPMNRGVNSDELQFLIVGSHTEKRILSTAMFLKNALGYANVAVCSHLVGSSTKAAHFTTLRQIFLSAGITVFLDLKEAAEFVGIDPAPFDEFSCSPCIIEPLEAQNALGKEQKAIVEHLCMHWTCTKLKPLQGGFSGSLLFLAEGWKGEARTEPMVIKIDNFPIMRRELEGYQQVFDYFGRHIPTFSNPVAIGDFIGIGMDLATMEGNPETLQDSFEQGNDERFTTRLDKVLELSTAKLYRNTQTLRWVAPYRRFHLHTDEQLQWLRENVACIDSYRLPGFRDKLVQDSEDIVNMLRLVAANEDSLESEFCIAHGDLNLKNIICDDIDNVWLIDWTHSGHHPAELDFAKLENEVKFVISKQFDQDDLPRLCKFEEYLLSNRIPALADDLPDILEFVQIDERYRNILDAVRRIRETCFSLKQDDHDWLVYRTALLKYALHTLSFDAHRNLGECDPTQLLHAFFSVESLVFTLVADDFHLKIRGERPESYPQRQRILIDEAPWGIACPDYAPPYYVAPTVLENAGTWADPENPSLEFERPQNPRGRTGIAGRGMLGKWGQNHMVSAVVTRTDGASGELEIVLGRRENDRDFSVPKGFVIPGEDIDAALVRILATEIGWQSVPGSGDTIAEGYQYDARQTDHAWVETHSRLIHQGAGSTSSQINPGSSFDEVDWWPLNAKSVNNLPANQAFLVREAVRQLRETGAMEASSANALLAKTG
jgi:ADP-ribose pyrophosphatase